MRDYFTRGYSEVVSRLVCIEKTPGSIPGSSTFIFFGRACFFRAYSESSYILSHNTLSSTNSRVSPSLIIIYSMNNLYICWKLLFFFYCLGPKSDDSVCACSEKQRQVRVPLAVSDGTRMVEFFSWNDQWIFASIIHIHL